MSYQVAVPSYRRHDVLARKTLPLLLDRGVPADAITVFVADDQEAELYAPVVGAAGVALHVAVPGMAAVRNYIAGHYPAGTQVVQCDDDITDVVRRLNDKQVEPVGHLPDIINEGFGSATAYGLNLWGIYPVLNPLFMKARTTADLRYIPGGLWGATQRGEPHQLVQLDDKEDFERSLRYYDHDGGVVRLAWVAARTTGYAGRGGMQVDRTDERVDTSARTLQRWFPDLCKLNLTKKSGRTELRLRDSRRTSGQARLHT